MQKRHLRRRYFVDPKVQTGLLKRIAFYWTASILFLTLPIAFAKVLAEPSVFFLDHIVNVFTTHWPVLAMLMFFLPFAMNDAIKFSNRFTGPVFRLRSELRNFEAGQCLKPIKFRQGDYWHDLAEGINRVGKRLNELEEQRTKANGFRNQIESSV